MVVMYTSIYPGNLCKIIVIYYLIKSKLILVCLWSIYIIFSSVLRRYRNWEVPFELAIRRMKVEICIGGGSIADTLNHATHLVIVSSPEFGFDFDTLLNRWAFNSVVRYDLAAQIKSYHTFGFCKTLVGANYTHYFSCWSSLELVYHWIFFYSWQCFFEIPDELIFSTCKWTIHRSSLSRWYNLITFNWKWNWNRDFEDNTPKYHTNDC